LIASPPLSTALPGIHRVRREHAGSFYEYWYAWRGGPRILAAKAKNPIALQRAVSKLLPDATETFKGLQSRTDDSTLYSLITRYLEAMERSSAAPRTKADRRKHLDIARAELGEMNIRLLGHQRARPTLLAWRDKRAKTPKTADAILGDLSTALNWAVERGEIAKNPVDKFPRIYSVDRSDVIWEPEQLAALLAVADDDVAHAVRLAALTGLRKGDLIALRWDAVKDDAIVRQTNKSRGRITAVIPLTEDLKAVLAMIPRRADTVLTSSNGTPWKAPGHGLDTSFRKAKTGAGESVTGLRFHDLRGTAATSFINAGISFENVAEIMGWKTSQVREIAKRYVSGRARGKGLLARISAAQNKAETVKMGVKTAPEP
jgi:integrase